MQRLMRLLLPVLLRLLLLHDSSTHCTMLYFALLYIWNQQTANNGLTFLLVLNAGHMVPMNVPEAASDMFMRFIQGKSFADEPQVELMLIDYIT
jgi:Serine carboxypeptidase